jgi:hypothetical protein
MIRDNVMMDLDEHLGSHRPVPATVCVFITATTTKRQTRSNQTLPLPSSPSPPCFASFGQSLTPKRPSFGDFDRSPVFYLGRDHAVVPPVSGDRTRETVVVSWPRLAETPRVQEETRVKGSGSDARGEILRFRFPYPISRRSLHPRLTRGSTGALADLIGKEVGRYTYPI